MKPETRIKIIIPEIEEIGPGPEGHPQNLQNCCSNPDAMKRDCLLRGLPAARSCTGPIPDSEILDLLLRGTTPNIDNSYSSSISCFRNQKTQVRIRKKRACTEVIRMTFGTNILVILVILSWVLAIEVNHQNQNDRTADENTREARENLRDSKPGYLDSNTTKRRMH